MVRIRHCTMGVLIVALVMSSIITGLIFGHVGVVAQSHGNSTRSAPVIEDHYPPTSSSLMIEGQKENYNYSVSVSDADGDDLLVTWYIGHSEYHNETITGGSGKSEITWIPPYDAVTEGIYKEYYINVSVYDGTNYANRSWLAKVYECSPPTEMNMNQSEYTKPLSIVAAYLYNTPPLVGVEKGLSVSEYSGNKSFGNPLFGYSYSIQYNLTVYFGDPDRPFPTVRYINMSIDFSNSTFKDEFNISTIRIVAWDFTRGHWNDVENIGEYRDLTIRKGTIVDKYISWLNITFGSSGTRSRDAIELGYLFHIALFGYRPLWVKYTEPKEGETGVDYDTRINVTFNQPLLSIEDLKHILSEKYGWNEDIVNETAANLTLVNATLLNGTGIDTAIEVIDPNENIVSGSVSYDMSFRRIIFTPDSYLQDDTTYTVRVRKDLMDTFGHYLDGNRNFIEGEDDDDYVWQFTTKEMDVIPPGPKVIQTYPVNGSTDVPLDTEIWVKFDRDMNSATFKGNVSVMDENFRKVNCTLQYNSSVRTLYIIPNDMLKSATTYTVEIQYKVTDVNGYHLDGNGDGHEGYSIKDNYVFTFSTIRIYYGNITVTVKDKDTGALIEGVGLELTGPIEKYGSTDENGTYTFKGIPLGNYTLKFTHPDYKDTITEISLDMDNLNYSITIELERNESQVVENRDPEIWQIFINGELVWENGSAKVSEVSFEVGENITFEVVVYDPDGDAVTVQWDMDIYTDSDNADGDNNDTTGSDDDVDAIGTKINYTYTKATIYKIFIYIEDDHGNYNFVVPDFRINIGTPGYLFTMDVKYQAYLKDGAVSSEIKQIFEKNDIPLSSNATVKSVESGKWHIVDGDSIYEILLENNTLYVYPGSKPTQPTTYTETEEMILGMPVWLFISVIVILVLVIAIIYVAYKFKEAGEEEEEEEEEEDTIECPNCNRQISVEYDRCPYCGTDLSLEEE